MIITSGTTIIDGKSRIIVSDVLKRPQESKSLDEIKGRYVFCRAQHLEGHSLKYCFHEIAPLKPAFIAADGDVKIQTLIKNTEWESPIEIGLDLAHQIKNSKKN